MKNEARRLAELLGPPAIRREPPDWADLEDDLGCPLPADYREWAQRYPTTVLHRVPRNFQVMVWDAEDVVRAAPAMSEQWRLDGREEAFFPEEGGLLAWGVDEEGGTYFWDTTGDPDEWRVVYCERHGFVHFDVGFTGFLAGTLAGEIRHRDLPPDLIGPGVVASWDLGGTGRNGRL